MQNAPRPFFRESLLSRAGLFQSGISSGRGRRSVKKPAAVLMLTSLIDAFSILVVYLLMFFSSAAEMSYVSSEIELPKAAAIERLDRRFIIQIRKDGYFAEEKKIEASRLTAFLLGLKKSLSEKYESGDPRSETITIQADKNLFYDKLSPVIQACGQTGFSDIKLAVLGE